MVWSSLAGLAGLLHMSDFIRSRNEVIAKARRVLIPWKCDVPERPQSSVCVVGVIISIECIYMEMDLPLLLSNYSRGDKPILIYQTQVRLTTEAYFSSYCS